MTGASGTFTAPDHEYPSYLELKLTATDASGLTDTKSVRLDPQTVGLTFASQPSGLNLTYLATTAKTPSVGTTIAGSSGSVSADLLQVSANGIYRFSSWSDGGARSHNFVAPQAPAMYTATYVPKRNLARGHPAAASSVYLAGREAAKAVDGSMTTAWSSARTDPQWFRADLGSIQVVNRVLLNWLSSAYGKAYQIQVSTSGRTWKTVSSTTAGDGGTDLLTFSPNYARYVRINATARGVPGSYYSLWEFGVFQDTGAMTGIAGKCVDAGTVALNTCNGATNQQWTPSADDGTVRSLGNCLDARATTPLTPAVMSTCDGSAGQKWRPRADGSLLNVRAGLCLDAAGGKSANGTKVLIYTCNNGLNQKWVLP
jgi:hypothetical protein